MIRDFLNTEDASDCAVETAACVRKTDCADCDLSVVDGLPLGMMYAPVQTFRKLYDVSEALCKGTLFCELNLPFQGGQRT